MSHGAPASWSSRSSQNYMGIPPEASLDGADAFNGGMPPWAPVGYFGALPGGGHALSLHELGASMTVTSEW